MQGAVAVDVQAVIEVGDDGSRGRIEDPGAAHPAGVAAECHRHVGPGRVHRHGVGIGPSVVGLAQPAIDIRRVPYRVVVRIIAHHARRGIGDVGTVLDDVEIPVLVHRHIIRIEAERVADWNDGCSDVVLVAGAILGHGVFNDAL